MTTEFPFIEDSELLEKVQRALAEGFLLEFVQDGECLAQIRGPVPSNGLKLLLQATSEADGIHERITLEPQILPQADLQALERARLKRERKAQRRFKAS